MTIDQVAANVLSKLQIDFLPQSIQFLIAVAPIFLAFLLGRIFWGLWVNYVRGVTYLKTKRTLLELKLPKDTWKSPKAMEIVLNSLHNTSNGSKFAQYWNGENRPWYSLEMASVEGSVKFYIWTEDARKQGVMSALYSQFPEIEIKEVEDYTKSVNFDPKVQKVWAAQFKFSNSDSIAYPIKTYVDYGLDKDPKEEFKVDPMLPLIEFMGSVGPNQQVWMQILIQAHIKDKRKKGHLFAKTDSWKDAAQEEKNKILIIKDPKTKVAGEINLDTGYAKLPTISEGEREIVAALERRIAKLPFNVGIRFVYIAKKESFNKAFAIGGIIGNMKQFSAEHLNGFKPNDKVWHPRLSDPWQDYRDYRRNKYSKLAILAFKMRSYFYDPFEYEPLVMNTEELATIYHFPGSVSQTPNLDRIPSKKAQAPGNLPI